jgi:hypothetical protein
MKRKISAKEFLADVRAGLTDVGLMDKYDLSAPTIHTLFKKLADSGLMSHTEMEQRMPLSDRSVSLEVYRCPACNMPQFTKFEECPQCGVIVKKVAPPSGHTPEAEPAGSHGTAAKATAPVSLRDETFPPPSADPQITAPDLSDRVQRTGVPPIAEAPSPPHTPSIQISVKIPSDMLHELNGLGGDLSDHITEAVSAYLKDRQTP